MQGVPQGKGFNTLEPEQYEYRFADDILKCISANQKFVLIQFSPKYVPNGPTNNTQALIMTQCCPNLLTHCGREDLWTWAIFNTILTSPKSWLSQEHLEAGCEYSLVPIDS